MSKIVIRLTLDTPPSSNRYWRMGKNRIYRSTEAVNYCNYVALLCNAEGIEPVDGDVCVNLNIYRPAKRMDTDNFLKVILDALQGRAYHNDSQIAEIHAMRFEDKHNPRVVVEVTAL